MRWKEAVAGPTRRSWAADGLLAVGLAVATVAGDLNRSYVELRPDADDAPVRLPRPPAPPDLPDLPEPGLPPVPRPVPAVEHVLAPAEPWEWALVVLTALPLALRRRFPLAVFWAVTAATVALKVWGDPAPDAITVTFASGLVAAYSAVVHSPHRKAAVASLLAGAVLYPALHLVPKVTPGLIPLLVLLPVGLAAQVVHTLRRRARQLQERQEEALRRAVAEERARIARELHDVVTHNVSMMTIQAGAARKVLDTAPEQAREAMRAVEAAGRTAMSELRHVMGLLTMTAEGPPSGPGEELADLDLAPQPGLDRLEELVDRVRATGVPVGLTVRGTPVEPPGGVGLAAYRVVQEALTNAVRHAEGARVAVTVTYAPRELRVEVLDGGGRTRAGAPEGGGCGLIGLRERLAVYGGTLRAGRRPTGGWRVRAVIPLAAAPATAGPESTTEGSSTTREGV
ncbi:sensor histidine kinase [Streptomyces sp. NPDC004787]|uniref:sensor histidine kinase n=1 Tax=Streptomyces sp. NPDC004787 TaxID=3154291 RepID=UPI0033BB7F3A